MIPICFSGFGSVDHIGTRFFDGLPSSTWIGAASRGGRCRKTLALKWLALKWGPMNIERLQWYLQRGLWCWLPTKGCIYCCDLKQENQTDTRRKGKYVVFQVPFFRDKLSVVGSVACWSMLLMYSCLHHQNPPIHWILRNRALKEIQQTGGLGTRSGGWWFSWGYYCNLVCLAYIE